MHFLASLYSSDLPTILAIKGGHLTDYNGKTIGSVPSSTILINPDIEATHRLQKWYTDHGFHVASPSLSRKYIGSMSRTHPSRTIFDLQSMQPSDKNLWFFVHASIVDINMDDFHFLACRLFVDGVQCMKKVAHRAFNTWHCSKM